MANELISVRIQDNCNFTGKDIEEKAAALGLNKSEFVLKAVDTFLHADREFLKQCEIMVMEKKLQKLKGE